MIYRVLNEQYKTFINLVHRAQKGDDQTNDQASLSSGFNTLSDMSESLPIDTVALGYEGLMHSEYTISIYMIYNTNKY